MAIVQPQQAGTGAGETPNSAAAQPQATGETPNAGETPTQNLTFESWFETLEPMQRELVSGHTSSLRSALEVERNDRKALAKQLKELSGKLEANSDAAQQLDALRTQMETTTRRAEFVEEAALAGCALPRQAWHIAQAENLSVAQMRSQYPQLFNLAPKAPAGAGVGTAAPPAKTRNMNDWIRQAAGKEG